MYTQHSACWDAKNRFSLKDPLPFDFSEIAYLFGECPPVEETHADPEPAPAPAPVEPVKDAKVETVQKIPESKTGKKGTGKPMPRPEEMRSDNPEKDKALGALWAKMQLDDVPEPAVLRAVVAEKEYYDLSVPVNEYDLDFINDVLIEAWDQVNRLCQTKIRNLPF
jgi:hypothetical protein